MVSRAMRRKQRADSRGAIYDDQARTALHPFLLVKPVAMMPNELRTPLLNSPERFKRPSEINFAQTRPARSASAKAAEAGVSNRFGGVLKPVAVGPE
jgi:hypothetical protein